MWLSVKLGEVISHRKEFITIDDTQEYKRCRVQLHAKGIVLRDLVTGTLIKTKQQQVCRSGEFLVAEIDAKVGGFGIVPDELDGAIVSSHYFLFTINKQKLDTDFLGYYAKTPFFRDQVNAQGSTNYAAIRPNHVLDYEIPLPPISEQRRIVAKIERLASKIEKVYGLRSESRHRADHFLATAMIDAFPEPKSGDIVGNYANVQSGYAFKSEWFIDKGIRLVRNINIGHGQIDWRQTVCFPKERREEFERFELKKGDILISLDRPIISTGIKVAKVTEKDLPSLLLQRVGRVQFFDHNVNPDFMFIWFQSPHFSNAIDPGRSNGVPHISQKDIMRIPFSAPPIEKQCRIVAYLNDLHSRMNNLKGIQSQTKKELDALLPSILDKAFKNQL